MTSYPAILPGRPAPVEPVRAPAGWRMLLVGVVLVCGAVTLPQRVQLGGISGLGALTVLWCIGVWALWLGRPWFPREQAGILLPLLMFVGFSVGSLLWEPPTVKGLQNLAVTVGFLGFILVAARHTERHPALAESVHRALDVGTAFATVTYCLSTIPYNLGAEDFILARPFALFAMIGVARQLSLWQAGPRKHFFIAAAVVAVIFLSLSRTALVAALALFPLAALVRGGRRGALTAAWLALAAVAALLCAVFLSETMYERFFGFDPSLEVGGVAINASGRREMWEFLLTESQDRLLFGHGAGAASILVDNTFENLGHPHNDFLRFLYDFGLFGLGCWLAFLAAAVWFLFTHARRRARSSDPILRRDLPYFLAPLLALLAVTASMFTDNSVGYSFIMAPLGILIGCAIGRARAARYDRWVDQT